MFNPVDRKVTFPSAPEPSKPAKRETFAAARRRILAELAALGWTVTETTSYGRLLCVPYATSADGRSRLWLKPQAVHLSVVSPPLYHQLGNARSLVWDMRGVSGARLASLAGVR